MFAIFPSSSAISRFIADYAPEIITVYRIAFEYFHFSGKMMMLMMTAIIAERLNGRAACMYVLYIIELEFSMQTRRHAVYLII